MWHVLLILFPALTAGNCPSGQEFDYRGPVHIDPTAHFLRSVSREEAWRRWEKSCHAVRYLKGHAWEFAGREGEYRRMLEYQLYQRNVYDCLGNCWPLRPCHRREPDFLMMNAESLRDLLGDEDYYSGRLPIWVPLGLE
jgi:hypothetical protein